MTDTGSTERQGQPGAPFVIVPTLDSWRQLLGRVAELEQRATAPAASAGPSLPADLQLKPVLDRLERHRLELESLKAWANDVNDYLRAIIPAGAVQPPNPGEYL